MTKKMESIKKAKNARDQWEFKQAFELYLLEREIEPSSEEEEQELWEEFCMRVAEE